MLGGILGAVGGLLGLGGGGGSSPAPAPVVQEAPDYTTPAIIAGVALVIMALILSMRR